MGATVHALPPMHADSRANLDTPGPSNTNNYGACVFNLVKSIFGAGMMVSQRRPLRRERGGFNARPPRVRGLGMDG